MGEEVEPADASAATLALVMRPEKGRLGRVVVLLVGNKESWSATMFGQVTYIYEVLKIKCHH